MNKTLNTVTRTAGLLLLIMILAGTAHFGTYSQQADASGPIDWTYDSGVGETVQNVNPITVDLDADGDKEIIMFSYVNNPPPIRPDGKIYIFKSDGQQLNANWPKSMQDILPISIAAGDVNGDGVKDIAVHSKLGNSAFLDNQIRFFDINGVQIGGMIDFGPDDESQGGLVLADMYPSLPGLEIVIPLFHQVAGPASVRIYRFDGTLIQSYTIDHRIRSSIAVGDLDTNGTLDIVGQLYADDAQALNGSFYVISQGNVTYYPATMNPYDVTLADLNNDGLLEIILPGRYRDSSGEPVGTIAVFNLLGTELWRRDTVKDLNFAMLHEATVYRSNLLSSPKIFLRGLDYDIPVEKIFGFESNGSDMPGWPILVDQFHNPAATHFVFVTTFDFWNTPTSKTNVLLSSRTPAFVKPYETRVNGW